MTVPAGLLAHYPLNETTLAYALKLTRADADVFGFTSLDEDRTVDSVLYKSDQGVAVTSIVTAVGTSVGNLEVTTPNDGTIFTFADILGGIWNNAAFEIGRYNWVTPADEMHILSVGTIGEIQIMGEELRIELRDLRQRMQQDIGRVSQKDCPYRVGSTSEATGGYCMKDISGSPFTQTGTVTTAGQQTFTASAVTGADDYFGDGEVRWLTGANAGQNVKVKTFGTGGVFSLVRPMFGTVANGDTATVIVGCRKRFEEDCITKFSNGVNFGGHPHLRGVNVLTASPE